MPIKLDLVGLNSLIYENVTSSTNTIGGNLVAIGDKSESLASLETTKSNAYLRGPVYAKALRSKDKGGNSQRLVGSVSGYSDSGHFSITTWLKLDTEDITNPFGSADFRTIFRGNEGANDTPNPEAMSLFIKDGEIVLRILGGDSDTASDDYKFQIDGLVSAGEWNHIAFTYDGDINTTTGVTFYLNAVSQSLSSTSTNAVGAGAGNERRQINNLTLFDQPTASPPAGFELQGSLMEFATWNTELTPSEVQDVSSSIDLNSLSFANDMIDYWKLGEEPDLNQYAWEQPDFLPAATTISSSLDTPNNDLMSQGVLDFSQGYYVSGSTFTPYTVAGGFSYSFWARLPAETSGTNRYVWSDSALNQKARFIGDRLVVSFKGSTEFIHSWSTQGINQTEWNHYAVTWRGDFAESPVLYVNKEYKGFGTLVGTAPNVTETPDTIDSLYILDAPQGGAANELNGELQDLAFYGKELSTSEVSELYGIGIVRPNYSSLSFQASILDYWSLGDETELNSYSIGQAIPNGTEIQSTLGHQNYLTARENIVKKDGHFQPYYNIMNIALNAAVDPRAHLAALNIHRGGLYGYSSFKQIRSSQNPLSRLHKANSIFSYIKEGGDYIQQKVGTQLVAFRERKGALTNITESAVISSHKPVTLVGTTSDDDDIATKTRVEIKASFGNENQYFGNEQANRDFGLGFDVVDGYEDLTNLYLDNALDEEFSPIEEFEVLKYSQTIFPKVGNSYLDEVRSRKNYTNNFWRDARKNRTETGEINNNFGFIIPSQSIWPLDVERSWAARTFGASQGEFTMAIPCNLAFNNTSASADGIEFSAADVHIWNFSAKDTPPGTNTTYLAEDATPPYNYKLKGEKFSLNSIAGTNRFWDAWAEALRAAAFAQVSHTSPTYVTRSAYYADRFNNPVADKFYLQVNPIGFVEADWKTKFNNMMLYFWFRNLSSTTKGYLYRELDSEGVNRRSVYFDGNQIQVQASTVFTTLDEDRNTSLPITASTLADGAIRRDITIPLQAGDIWSSGQQTGDAAIGREFNNVQIFMDNSGTDSPSINDIVFSINNNAGGALLNTTTQDSSNFYSGGILFNDGSSFAYKLSSLKFGCLRTAEQLENLATDRSLDFSNPSFGGAAAFRNGEAVFNFALNRLGANIELNPDNIVQATQAESYAQTIFYGDSEPLDGYDEAFDGNHLRNYIWLYVKDSFEEGSVVAHLYVQMGVLFTLNGQQHFSHVRASFDISDYRPKDQFVQFSVSIIGDAIVMNTGAANHRIRCHVGVNGSPSPTELSPVIEPDFGLLTHADTDGNGIFEGVSLFPGPGAIHHKPITRYSLFGLCGTGLDSAAYDFDTPNPLGTADPFNGSSTALYYSANGGDNKTISPSAASSAGALSLNEARKIGKIKYAGYLKNYVMDQFAIIRGSSGLAANASMNVVLNFTGSAYTGTGDIFAWYKLGDQTDPDEDFVFPITKNFASNSAGGHNDLNLSASFTNIEGNLGIITEPVELQKTQTICFPFKKTEGMANFIKSPVGYYTSSVSEAFVMCKSGSGNNSSDDYLHNLTASSLALFRGSDAISIPTLGSKYCWQDLTSSAFAGNEPQIWYTFDGSGLDEIKLTGSFIANSGTLGAAYNLTGTYIEGVNRGTFTEGPIVSGSARFLFKATQPYQGQGTNQSFGTGITGFVSSSLQEEEAAVNFYLGGSNNASGGAGILMNSYNSFNASHTDTAQTLDSQLYSGPLYTRRHSLRKSTTFGNPFGIPTNIGATRDLHLNELFQGMAFWDCGDQANRNPFDDTYSKFIEDERLIAKDHTIIPEFRLSSHVDKYLKTGDTDFEATDNSLFEMLGGANNATGSNESQFYEIYSTTDFLRNFEIIQSDHKGFVDPLSLTLKCKAIKKFLPYDGFYPAERTTNIAEQFYSSYADHITVSSSFSDTTGSVYAKQMILNPLFSPGILFNTIKAGIACDYPIMTGSFMTASLEVDGSITGSYYIDQQFDRRIPFEAIIEPEKYIANVPLGSQEPDPRGFVEANATWNGQGDERYRLMVSNFLSEVGDFFLENSDYSTIASLPEGDPNFGNAIAGRTYMMRLRMFRSTDGAKTYWTQDSSTYEDAGSANRSEGSRIAVPQDSGNSDFRENFTMYSRPSAFGPPQRLSLTNSSGYNVKFDNWRDFKFAGSSDTFYSPSPLVGVTVTPLDPTVPAAPYTDLRVHLGQSHYLIGNDASQGYNYPFTPPYYHGEAWADFTFTATESKKYSLSEILASSSVEFTRYYEPVPAPDTTGVFTNWRLVNEDAMQLASSMNLKSRGILSQDFESNNLPDSYRWIIQSKFETPTLNFNKYRYNSPRNPITLPFIAAETTPIGMWHQYGELPQSPDKGIFVEVTEVPENWIENAMGGSPSLTGSLAQLCGFSSTKTRIGEIKNTKRIKEAVIAIPFIDKEGERKFFNIPRSDIDNSLSEDNRNLVGNTINDMVDKMKEFVLPPSMDFISNRDIEPFAMYIFSFEHTFTKQDLANIWQNISPDVGVNSEQVEATISHELLNQELLGAGAVLESGVNKKQDLVKDSRYNELSSNIKWLVFKAKQRASTNYFEKIFERNESNITKSKGTTVGTTGAKTTAQYNWPYDFFSLVELVKIDAEVNFAKPSDSAGVVIEPITRDSNKTGTRTGSKQKRKQTIKSKKR